MSINSEFTRIFGRDLSAKTLQVLNNIFSQATSSADTDVSGNAWVLDEDDMSSDSATKVPTQQSVKAYSDAGNVFISPIAALVTDMAVTSGIFMFRVPYACTIISVNAVVTTAPTGTAAIFDIKKNGTSIFTTNLISIDATTIDSDDAVTPPNITTTSLVEGDIMTADITQIGSTIAGQEPQITIKVTR